MRFGAKSLRAAVPALAILVFAALPAAAQTFGPKIYVRSASPSPDVFTDTFTAAAGGYALWVQNGDDGGGLAAGDSIAVNGSTVVAAADFAQDFVSKRVKLNAGANSITVTLSGDAGSFITVGIVQYGIGPEANLGHLILPYGSDAANLVLELRNDSARDRQVKVNFYDAAGDLVASSALITLTGRQSLSQTAQSLISGGTGSWTEGSIEVFWAGRGRGRLFGQAALKEATTQIASVVPLQSAGWVRRVLAMGPDPF